MLTSPRSSARSLLLSSSLAALSLASGCALGGGAPERSTCASDSDCAGDGELCVFDLGAAGGDAALIPRSYCTRRCAVDGDCPATHRCSTGNDRAESGAATLRICVERVRTCALSELCNGLDDDCDGDVDGPSCAPISDCLDDEPCGAFVCRAPDGAPSTTCQAANPAASLLYFSPCTADDQCTNGLCETGVCSPMCRPRSPSCPPDAVCAQAVGPRARPPHNGCQEVCKTSASCPAPQECVFREAYRGPDAPPENPLHAFVCSSPGPERLPLGAACSAHGIAGNDECAHGLCFGLVCTRGCSRGESCDDVRPGFVCLEEVLRYGNEQIVAEVCEAQP